MGLFSHPYDALANGWPGGYASLLHALLRLERIFSLGDANLACALAVRPLSIYLPARALSAVFGAASILPVYGLARAWRSEGAGLFAAAAYAVNLLAVRDGHFAVTDAPLCFLVACYLWACGWKALLGAGAFARAARGGVRAVRHRIAGTTADSVRPLRLAASAAAGCGSGHRARRLAAAQPDRRGRARGGRPAAARAADGAARSPALSRGHARSRCPLADPRRQTGRVVRRLGARARSGARRAGGLRRRAAAAPARTRAYSGAIIAPLLRARCEGSDRLGSAGECVGPPHAG